MAQYGQLIDGRYRIINEIGSGGTSVVYLVSDNHLNKNFAIKEIKKDDFANSGVIAGDLIDEANIMNKLNHPLLPRIIDVIDRGSYVYVVMDYIQGQSLDKVRLHYNTIPQEYVIHWFKQLCEVLTYLHVANPPIIFRDLKPSNIILTFDGSIRLIDFGAAREFKHKQQNIESKNWGTKNYAAPEQVMYGIADARSDIYSLGVTMHHLLTGADPGDYNNSLKPIRMYNPKLSPELEKIIDKCTRIRPEERYQNCRELYFELSAIGISGKNNKRNKKGVSGITIASIVVSVTVFVLGMLIFIFSMFSSPYSLTANCRSDDDFEIYQLQYEEMLDDLL